MTTKCRSWSYRAWEVIQLLPTYPPCMEDFQRVLDVEMSESDVNACWKRLFDSSNLHYFLYLMQCLEMLAHKREKVRCYEILLFFYIVYKVKLFLVRGIRRYETYIRSLYGSIVIS